MSGESDAALQSIFDVLTRQHETISKQYSDDSASVCKKKFADIGETFSNSAEMEKILQKDIQESISLIKWNKVNQTLSSELEGVLEQTMHTKERQLAGIQVKLTKKIEVLIHDYNKDLTRVTTTFNTIMAENNAALKIASDRVKMRNQYNNHYTETAAYENSYQLQDALHTRSTLDATARNPYVMDFE